MAEEAEKQEKLPPNETNQKLPTLGFQNPYSYSSIINCKTIKSFKGEWERVPSEGERERGLKGERGEWERLKRDGEESVIVTLGEPPPSLLAVFYYPLTVVTLKSSLLSLSSLPLSQKKKKKKKKNSCSDYPRVPHSPHRTQPFPRIWFSSFIFFYWTPEKEKELGLNWWGFWKS